VGVPTDAMKRISLAILPVFLAACGHQGAYSGGFFTKRGVQYYAGGVPPGWRVQNFRGNDIAYVAEDSEHLIAINATCEEYEDAPLKVLTQQMLMGFTERKLVKQELRTLQDREAMYSHYLAKMDGVPRELMLVVLKKDGCVYDFMYISPPGSFEEKLATFEEILQRFRTEPRR
jgi:hypothetical protein